MINEQWLRPPVAVVGVSALFPGSADSTGFWSDILAGTDRMTSVPPTHWLIDDHYDADPSTPDKTYGRRGGFLDPIDFDSMGFGVPPSAVTSTDTAQLLALIVAQRVLDDAMRGQFADLDRSRASVILGVTSGQELLGAMASRMNRPMWLQGMRRAGVAEDVAQDACDRILALHPEWTESTFPGLLGNVVAGRIANRLDLGGTNCVTDAACASSFSAISMGINELYLGDSDLVIAGGVDTMNDIFMYMCFSKTPALSKTEDIRPFSDEADGTMLGEGIGMVALKRLADAERDGNDVYCVVNGVGASSDGRSKSVYAPVSSGQARALDNAYAKAGYGPDTVELVEAHGTGTVAGDAAEFGGLELAFDAADRPDRQWCALGSVKSQIGHTKAAAGAAGLFKIVMALHHRVLPQTAKIDRPNPELDLENSPFYLNTRTRPWVRGSDHERRGSVSSFGFGGSNFHVTLSEYVGGNRAPRLRTADAELVVVCAADANGVVAAAERHLAAAERGGVLQFAAQTSQHAYDASAQARLAITARDDADLVDKLRQATSRIEADPAGAFSTPTGIHYRTGVHAGDVAFIFPGQGSQYLSMGSDLAMNFSEAMDAWDLAADQDWDGAKLHEIVFPPTSFADRADEADLALLTATDWAQPAIGTTSLGLLRVLRAIGLEPRHVGGHSFGEVTALHAAGAVSEVDLLRIARRRGSLMAEAARTPGSMTAVTGTIDDVRLIVDESHADVVIANHNSQRQVVLSGPTPAIEEAERALSAAGIPAKRLPVATAFHSSVVSGAGDAFAAFLDGVTFTEPSTPLYSNETAEPYPGTDPGAMRSQLARQLSRPVRFVEMIDAMYERGARTFVEVGPGSVLTGLVDTILDERDHLAVPLDRKGHRGLFGFFDGIGRLAAAGVEMDLAALWREYGTMADPHQAPQPKLAIAISGANAGAPYPPHDLNELVGANPVTSGDAPTVRSRPVSEPSAPPSETPTRPGVAPSAPDAPIPTVTALIPTARTNPMNSMSPTNPTNPITPTNPTNPITPTISSISSGPSHSSATPAQSATPDAGVLSAFRATQEHTAAAHATYLESTARTHAAYLDAAQAGIVALSRLAGVPIADAPQHDAQAAEQQPTVAAAPSAPPATTEPVATTPTVDDRPRPAATSRPQPSEEASPGDRTSVDMMQTLLDIVSERTGYPADMLTTDMELESDLGIDSIKRVEILSAMQDNVPDLPDVDLAVLAGLATLGQIVDYLTQQRHQHLDQHLDQHTNHDTTTATTATTATATPTGDAPAVAIAPAATPTVDMMQTLLDIVSERTGYPADMLTTDMELESDLGIDSIKRVEILSAMQDNVPDLPDVDLAVLAGLATLGHIVDYLTQQRHQHLDQHLDQHTNHDTTTATTATTATATPTGDAPAVAIAPAATPTVDMMQTLLDIVSERTGYPADMLTTDMELESDLGIDSIKRVEILSAMQDNVPDLPDVDLAVLAGLATLGHIVDYLTQQRHQHLDQHTNHDTTTATTATTATATPTGTATPPDPAGPAAVGRFVVQSWPSEPSGVPCPGVFDGPIAVTDDGAGVAEALVSILSGHGIDAAPADGSTAQRRVVYLGNLRSPGDADQARAFNSDAFAAAKAFAVAEGEGGLFIAVDDRGDASGASGDDATRAWAGGLGGLTRTAAIEWPSVTVRLIEVERAGRAIDQVAHAIAAELLHGGDTPEVRLTADGQRFMTRLTAAPLDEGTLPLDASDVVVVSGGGRGVTAAATVELARESGATFVLLGRSELSDEPDRYGAAADDAALKRVVLDDAKSVGETMTPHALDEIVGSTLANREIRATIASITEAGGRALYVAVDITDLEALERAIVTVRAEVGPVTGVVHGAGVLADKLIVDKTSAQFDRVFETKVVGLGNLLSVTDDDDLRVLCLFSSIAARTGNAGQSDYAMANEVLNKVAIDQRARRGDGCVVKSLGWGPWAGGMVTPELARHFDSIGVDLIPIDVGARMLVDEIAGPQTDQVEVFLGGDLLAPVEPVVQPVGV